MNTPTTREEVIEVMARALHKDEWAGQPGPEPFKVARNYWMKSATAALEALEAAGLAVVPVEATEEMDLRGCESDLCDYSDAPSGLQSDSVKSIYTAMLDASPYKEN